MRRPHSHAETHFVSRVGWLRAAVLGANDGIVSTSSLVIGVAAAGGQRSEIVVAGVAGLIAGAMSMAAGEYVSVSSQADSEEADLAREKDEIAADPAGEQAELAAIYVARGVTPETANEVAAQLMAKDALAAHAQDELGIVAHAAAKPVQAAYTSALTFTVGAALPLLMAFISPLTRLPLVVAVASLIFLAILGAAAAKTGGASIRRAMLRVTFWGTLAMAITAGIGALIGTVV